MLIFNLTILHLWGRVLTKFPETRVIAYVDDGYTKDRMSVLIPVLVEIKCVLKMDVGLDLNVSKTSVLPKGVSQSAVFDVDHNIINDCPTLTHIRGDVLLDSFCPITNPCKTIIDDVEELDAIQDRFIHYQILRF